MTNESEWKAETLPTNAYILEIYFNHYTPQDVMNAQAKVQTLAFLTQREEMDEQQNGADQTRAASASTTTPPPEAPPSLLDTLLDSNSSSDSGDGENETVDLNSQIRDEVHAYLAEKPLPKNENPLQW